MTKYCYQMLFLLVVSSGDVFICNIFEQTKYTQLTNPVVCCINIEYYGFWIISSGKHVYLTMRIQSKLWLIYSDHAICAQRMVSITMESLRLVNVFIENYIIYRPWSVRAFASHAEGLVFDGDDHHK